MIYWIWIFIDDFLFDSLLSTVLTFACLLMPWHCHGKRVQRRVWRAEGCAQREGLNKRSLLKSVCFREGLQCPQWSSFFIRKKINGGVFFRCHMDFFEEFFILSTLGIPIIFSCSSDRNKRFTPPPPTTHHLTPTNHLRGIRGAVQGSTNSTESNKGSTCTAPYQCNGIASGGGGKRWDSWETQKKSNPTLVVCFRVCR